jgi:hypothetical protein
MKIKGIIAAAVLFLACQSAPEIPADNSDITGKALVLNSIDYGVADRWYKIISETAPRILSVNSVVHGQHFFHASFFPRVTDGDQAILFPSLTILYCLIPMEMW